jgi:hypothetical protein
MRLSCPLHPTVHISPTAPSSSCRTGPTQPLSDPLGMTMAVTLMKFKGVVPTYSATRCRGNISRDSKRGKESIRDIPPRFPAPFRGIRPMWGIQDSGFDRSTLTTPEIRGCLLVFRFLPQEHVCGDVVGDTAGTPKMRTQSRHENSARCVIRIGPCTRG